MDAARLAKDTPKSQKTRARILDQAMRLIAEIGLGMPDHIDDHHWSVPVSDGTRSAVTAVKALAHIGVDVTDATVTSPTLDDVFLTLTGRRTQKEHAHVR